MRGSSLVVPLATVLAVAVTARLGVWQLDRAAEKQRLQASRDTQTRRPHLGTHDLARDPTAAAEQVDRRIVLEGRWLVSATVFLENRPMAGRVGFHVLTPLQLDDGRAVVVQRGWLPRDAVDRTRIAPFETAAGRVRLQGRIAPTPSRLYQLGESGTGPIRQNLDLVAYAAELRRDLVPVVVVQEDDAASAAPDGLLRQWPQPDSGVHKHHGYAFQWFGLSALVVILYVWFQLIRPRRRKPH